VNIGRIKLSVDVRYFQPSLQQENISNTVLQPEKKIRAHRVKTDLHNRFPPTANPVQVQPEPEEIPRPNIEIEPAKLPEQTRAPIEPVLQNQQRPETVITYEVPYDTHTDIDDLLLKVRTLDQDLDTFAGDGNKAYSPVDTDMETEGMFDNIVLTLDKDITLDPALRAKKQYNDSTQSQIIVDESFSPSISTTSSRSVSPDAEFDHDPVIENKEGLKGFREYEKRVMNKVHSSNMPAQVERFEYNDEELVNDYSSSDEPEIPLEPIKEAKRIDFNDQMAEKTEKKKQQTHSHTHLHVQRPQYRMLLHILNGRLISTPGKRSRGVPISLTYKVTLHKKPETRMVKNFDLMENKATKIDARELILLDAFEPADFVPKLGHNSIVIELHNKGENSYFGILPISLRPFYEMFTHPDYSQDSEKDHDPLYLNRGADMPVIAFHGSGTVTDPLTDQSVARLNLMLAFGSKGQITRLMNAQKSALTIQRFYRNWIRSRARSNVVIKQTKGTFVDMSPRGPILQQNKKEEAQLEEINILSDNSDTSDSDDEYEDRVVRRNHRVKKAIENRPSPRIPLGNRAALTVKVIRATGLQKAAQAAFQHLKDGWKKSSMEASCQTGVNPRVQYENLLPPEVERDYDDTYSTEVQARTHFPVWNHQKKIDFIFDRDVYDHFDQAEVTFTLFHHIPKERVVNNNLEDEKNKSNIIPIAESRVPLFPLLRSPGGISDWCMLYSLADSSIVGALEISLQLDERTKSLLFSDDDRHFHNNTLPVPTDVCRFTIVVEELKIPQDTLRTITPLRLREKEVFTCRYLISYRFYDKDRIESRPYVTSSIIPKLSLNHTMERKLIMDPVFVNRLMCEKLSIDLHVIVGDEDDTITRDTRNDLLYLGTAYVDMSQLMYKRQASNKGTVLISGVIPIINPTSANMTNGSIRVKVMCETLSKNAALEYLERMGYNARIQKQLENQMEDHYDSDDDGEPEITMDEFDSRFRFVESDRDRIVQEEIPVLEEPITPKRKRVVEVKTVTPHRVKDIPPLKNLPTVEPIAENIKQAPQTPPDDSNEEQEIDHSEEDHVSVASGYSEDEDDDRVEVINQLNICIERAYHLRPITTTWSAKPILPSCYVKILTFRDDFDASRDHTSNPNTGSFSTLYLKEAIDNGHVRAKTDIVRDNICPEWNYFTTLPLTRQIDSIVFQVWHNTVSGTSSASSRDKLIGECVVDLGMLAYGLDRIDGWYHLENRSTNTSIKMQGGKQPIAQVKVSIAPEKPYVLIHRPSREFETDNIVDHYQFDDREEKYTNLTEDPRPVEDTLPIIDEINTDDIDVDDTELRERLKTALQDLEKAMATVTQDIPENDSPA
jgi:hypothetical protein